jgi:hypothetical protein
MQKPRRIRRAVIAATGAALLLAGAAGANAAGGPQPGVRHGVAARPDTTLVSPVMAPGSELLFVAVAPCRIVDTRRAGGKLSASSRTFDATLASYASQGGKAGTCNVPDIAMAVQLNLSAISTDKRSSWLIGWAAGQPEPTASMLNTNPAAPIANMVTMPVNASGQFTLKTPGSMDVFADVAGYYVQPLYATIDGGDGNNPPSVVEGVASGLVSVTRESAGIYDLTFDRNVTSCVATANDFEFGSGHDIAIDSTISLFNPAYTDGTIVVGVTDMGGAFVDAMIHVSLTC